VNHSEQQPVEGKPFEKENFRPAGPRRGLITLWVVLTLLGLLAAFAGGLAFYVWNGLRPAPPGEMKTVELKRGMSPFQFAEVLEKDGIIRNSFLFKYYLRYKHEGPRFQAGVYELKPGMDKDAIIAKLNAGETAQEKTVRVTIPEGYTVLQIADTLGELGIVDKTQFLQAADTNTDWGDAEAVRSIPNNAKLRHRLEGYLFPDTYELPKNSKPQDIIGRMVQELDRKLDTLPEDWQDTLAKRKLDLHQLLTVASLVEREVVVDKERPVVAGIIYNRLAKGMPLQIDATVQYLLDKPKERLLLDDLKVESPYNTYLHKGLPPGPIASPSLKSIEAALYPAETDYLYYVTKKDGSHEHLFARTLREHNRNIEISNATAKQGGAK
jgi:UPF0755 protein